MNDCLVCVKQILEMKVASFVNLKVWEEVFNKLASLDLDALLRTFEFIHYAQNNAWPVPGQKHNGSKVNFLLILYCKLQFQDQCSVSMLPVYTKCLNLTSNQIKWKSILGFPPTNLPIDGWYRDCHCYKCARFLWQHFDRCSQTKFCFQSVS